AISGATDFQNGQLATISNGFGHILYQTIVNPKGNVSVIILRSGKESPQQQTTLIINDSDADFLVQQTKGIDATLLGEMRMRVIITRPFISCKGSWRLLDSSRFPSFSLIEYVFALIQPALPKKCRDPDTFTIPCTIDEFTFAYAMLDLGVLINVMPSLVYRSLKFGDLEPTSVIQLANKSIVHPFGILKDVLVQQRIHLKLRQTILNDSKTKFDVHVGTLSMELGDNMVQFNIFEAMKHPTKNHSVFGLNPHYGLSAFSKFSDFVGVADLAEDQKLPIISRQEERLQVLSKHRKVIGRTLANLPKINPSISCIEYYWRRKTD
ncbi:hypothetical protein CR513_56945, partial [Mucuna pruriens]